MSAQCIAYFFQENLGLLSYQYICRKKFNCCLFLLFHSSRGWQDDLQPCCKVSGGGGGPKLNMNQQSWTVIINKASCLLSLHEEEYDKQTEQYCYYFSVMLVKPHLKYCLAFHFKKDAETVERGCQDGQGLQHTTCERWLRDLGLLSLEKMGNVIAGWSCLKYSHRDGSFGNKGHWL